MHSISSWSEEVDTGEKMDVIDSDASKKRKLDCDGEMEAESDGEMSLKRHKSVNETNPQFGAGRVEPEKEKNPQPENGGGVEEDEVEDEDENNNYVYRSTFKENYMQGSVNLQVKGI